MLFSRAILFRLSPFLTVYFFTAGVSDPFSRSQTLRRLSQDLFCFPGALLFLFLDSVPSSSLFNPERLTDFQRIILQDD